MSRRPGGRIRDRLATRTHPDDVRAVHQRLLDRSAARSHLVEVAPARRIHVIEADDGPPLVLIHGSRPSALFFLPLMERLSGARAIAVDRPGFGLSDGADLPRTGYREAAVDCLSAVLDNLGLEDATLLGHSFGGIWALWYALAQPRRVRRLIMLGAGPLLPGTRAPMPLRLISSPRIGALLVRVRPVTPKTLVQDMAGMRESDTIVAYPDQMEALVVAGHDPLATATIRSELHTLMSLSGWRAELMLQPAELREVSVPTLLIWGDRDPLGGEPIARAVADAIPDAQLQMLPAGHIPWLGHPDRTATLISNFVR
jgi:pimeloyl-ACP methyl ester carboxylesterase